jgi:O-antigen/teichoic acid export membrane protein
VNWRTVLRNIFSNWIGYIVTSVVSFLLAPYVVHRLGNTGYGVWTLILSLTGYFGLLDLGIRSSVGRFVARYVAREDSENVNRTINTAIMLLASGGLLAVIASVVMYLNFGSFKVDHQLASAAKTALLIAGLNLSMTLPLGVFTGVLIALERFDVVSTVTILIALVRAALVVVFLKLGYGIVTLALISLVLNMAEYSAIILWTKYLYPPLSLSLHFLHLATLKELLSFGIYRFVWIIANQLIFYTDSVVIGLFIGAAAITYYAIAGSLIDYGRSIVTFAVDTLYPAASRLDSRKDISGLQQLHILGTKIALLITLPLCLGFLFFGKQFITLWMGKEYAISATYLAILTIPQFTSLSQYSSCVVLAGMARHKTLAYIAVAEGVCNALLSIILVKKIGVIGVAWGTVIPHMITTAVIVPLYTLRTLKMGISEYIVKAYFRPVLCALPVAGLCYVLSMFIETPSWFVFGAEVLVVCGSFTLMAYFFCLNATQQASVLERVWRLFHKEPVVNEA